MVRFDRRRAAQPVRRLDHVEADAGRVGRCQAQQAHLLRPRCARQRRFPGLFGGFVEERAHRTEVRLGLREGDPGVRAVREDGAAGQAGAARAEPGHVVEGRAGDAEVDHREHLRRVGQRRVAVERLVDRRAATADERPLRGDEGAVHPQVVAAGAAHAERVPGVDDLDPPGRQHRGARPARGPRADADAEVVGGEAAAGQAPLPADAEPARLLFGGLHREERTGEHEVRAVGVEPGLGLRWQRGEIDARSAETGDPAGRSVHFGHPLDHREELRGRPGVTAEALRCGRPVEPGQAELVDDVPRHVPQPGELPRPARHLRQRRVESGRCPPGARHAPQGNRSPPGRAAAFPHHQHRLDRPAHRGGDTRRCGR